MGATHGTSDRLGAYPDSDATTPGDLAATLFWRFGLDHTTPIHDASGRPYRLAEGEPLGDMLLATIQPKVVIIADAPRPATRHAGRNLRERLAGCHIPVIYESDTGAVTISVRRNRWELHAMDGTHLSWPSS